MPKLMYSYQIISDGQRFMVNIKHEGEWIAITIDDDDRIVFDEPDQDENVPYVSYSATTWSSEEAAIKSIEKALGKGAIRAREWRTV